MKKVILGFSIVIALAVTVSAAGVAYLLFTSRGAETLLRLSLDRFSGAAAYSWSRLEGNLIHGIKVKDLEIKGAARLPRDSILRIQDLNAVFSAADFSGIEMRFSNARLVLPESEPIVAEGTLRGGRLSANVYTRTFGLSNIRLFFPGLRRKSFIKGSLKEVDLVIEGTLRDFTLKGQASVEHWRYERYLLEDCPVDLDLRLERSAQGVSLNGRALLKAGTFLTPNVKAVLRPSRLYFHGDPTQPSFDISAVARVAKTKIDIVIRGTREKPDVDLASDPSLPKEQLILMLATGKVWSGISRSNASGKVPPDMAADFVDSFLFGGMGTRLVRKLGLSGFSIQLDEKSRGFMLDKDITDRFGVGYGVTTPTNTTAGQPRQYQQKLEGQYDITDKFSLDAEHGGEQGLTTITPPDQFAPTANPKPDDKVYLKYKTSF